MWILDTENINNILSDLITAILNTEFKRDLALYNLAIYIRKAQVINQWVTVSRLEINTNGVVNLTVPVK